MPVHTHAERTVVGVGGQHAGNAGAVSEVVRRVAVGVGEVVAGHSASGELRQFRQTAVQHGDEHVGRALGDVPREWRLDGSTWLRGILVVPLSVEVWIVGDGLGDRADPIRFCVFEQRMILDAGNAETFIYPMAAIKRLTYERLRIGTSISVVVRSAKKLI